MSGKKRLYFAFGSNMLTHRMQQRVPSARPQGVARLDGFCLTFHKRGSDATGKCSIERMEGYSVWGVLYRLKASEIGKLDTAEGNGYARTAMMVSTPRAMRQAFTYQAKQDSIIEAAPAEWYRDIVVAGAKEHGLPPEWIEQLSLIEAEPDNGG